MKTKCTEWSQNIPNIHKIFKMAIKYIGIFQSEALKFVPQFKGTFISLSLVSLAFIYGTYTKVIDQI
jgi:hypothetical protein